MTFVRQMERRKRLKQKLQNRERVFGGWVSYVDPAITETFCKAGFDFVAIDMEHRGKGYAHQLTNRMLEFIADHYPSYSIKISAQSYLQAFYGSHGFKVVSEEYLEDGIPHIAMQLSARE